jgi:chromate transporter
MSITLHAADWLALLAHFLSLSLLAVGGAITTAPDMHRYLVTQQHWLSDAQFNSSIALAQAAPGPNVLFIALFGWNVGINAGGGVAAGYHAWPYAALGVLCAMLGILVPSTTLTFAAARWGHQNRELRPVRAFKQGMAPIVIALLIATGWILSANQGTFATSWPLWLLTVITALLVWRTRIHMLWLLAAGGVLGWFGWI